MILTPSSSPRTRRNRTARQRQRAVMLQELEPRVMLSAFDPNDQISEALGIAVGSAVDGTLSPAGTQPDPGDDAGDVDMYAFTVAANQKVEFAIGDREDTYIRIFDASGTQLAANQSGETHEMRADAGSCVEYAFTIAGTYYLGVSEWCNTAYDATTGDGDSGDNSESYFADYTLTLTDLGAYDGELVTPLSSTIRATISPAGDVDRYCFAFTSYWVGLHHFSNTGLVAFDIDTPSGGGLDSSIQLFSSIGTLLASNNDAPAPGETTSVDSYVTYDFTSAGWYYLSVSGLSASTGDYTLSLKYLGDPNDQIGEALATSVGGTVTGTISPARTAPDPGNNHADVDMYAFAVTANQSVGFNIDLPSGSGLDSYLRLFDASGTPLAANDNGAATGEAPSLESYLTYSFTSAGTYYLGVSGGNSSYSAITGSGSLRDGSTGDYSLTLINLVDPNDQISEAITTDLDSTVSGTISPAGTLPDPDTNAGDVDLYAFTVAANNTLRFDIDLPAGSGLDPCIRLFKSNGLPMASSNDGAAPGEAPSLESYLEYTFAVAGTYYLGVSGMGNTAYDVTTGEGDGSGSTGDYTLTLTSLADPDDQISEAIVISVGSTVSGTTNPTGTLPDPANDFADVDMYAFTVTADQSVGFDIDLPAGGDSTWCRTVVRLFHSDGWELDCAWYGPAPGETWNSEPYLEYTFTDAGTYYVGVSEVGNWNYDATTGRDNSDQNYGYAVDYMLTLTDVADPDDQISEAIGTTVGSTVHGTLCPTDTEASDVDMYAFTAAANQSVRCSNGDAGIRLFNADGTQLAANFYFEDGATFCSSYLEYTFITAGTYYLGVSAWSNGNYSATTGGGDCFREDVDYTLCLIELVGDPNDQIREATPVWYGDSFISGTISPTGTQPDPGTEAGDVNVYYFEVPANANVAFDIDLPSGSELDSYLRLFDSNGTQLAANDDGAAPCESQGLESYLEYTFTTAGSYYLGVSGWGNEAYNATTGGGDYDGSTGDYTLTLTDLRDSDDQIDEAPAIWVGDYLSGEISPAGTQSDPGNEAGDVDMYTFEVTDIGSVRFDIDVDMSDLFPYVYLRLFDSSGTELASTDGVYQSYLDYAFTTVGTYYLGVSGWGNWHYNATTGEGDSDGSTGDYWLRVYELTDPDDQISEALATSVGSAVDGTIRPNYADDSDVTMFSFTVAANQCVRCRIYDDDYSEYADNFILGLRLFDASGTQLASTGDIHLAYLDYTFATAGTYYLGVSERGNVGYSATTGDGDGSWISWGYVGDYSLTLIDLDQNDRIGAAIAVPVGDTVSGTISHTATQFDPGSHAGDVDMYAFTTVANQCVQFDINLPSGSGLDSYLRLFDASGTQLAANDDGAAPGETPSLESFLEYTFTTAGTYYLGVSGWGNTAFNATTGEADASGSIGDYTLTLANLRDPNDRIDLAFAISVGGAVSGTISPAGTQPDPGNDAVDVDMYAFAVTANQSVGFNIDLPSGSGLDSCLRLFDSSGTELAANNNGAAPGEITSLESYLEYRFTSAGTYYLGVSGLGNEAYNATTGEGDASGSTGDYTLTLTAIEPPGPHLVAVVPVSDMVAGSKVHVVVNILDADGQVITTDNGRVTFTLSGPISKTVKVSAKKGIASLNLTITKAGAYTLAVAHGPDSKHGAEALSLDPAGFDVVPAAAQKMVFTLQPASTIAGVAFSAQVTLRDKYGNVATNDASTVTLTSRPAGLAATAPVQDGVAVFSNLILTKAGKYKLLAGDGALRSVTSKSFTISPDSASSQLVLLQPQPPTGTVLVGKTIKPAIKVAVEDQYGNVVSADHSQVAIGIVSGSGGILKGTTIRKLSKGFATFNNLSLTQAGSYTLGFTDGSLAILSTLQITLNVV
jgi:hypothetical protein